METKLECGCYPWHACCSKCIARVEYEDRKNEVLRDRRRAARQRQIAPAQVATPGQAVGILSERPYNRYSSVPRHVRGNYYTLSDHLTWYRSALAAAKRQPAVNLPW